METEEVRDPQLKSRIQQMIAERRRREAEGGSTSKSGKKGKKVAAPPPPQEEPELDIQQTVDAFSPVAFALMSPLTNRIDPEQPYTMEEARLLTQSVVALSQKYPEFDYSEELAVVLVIGAQLGGRYLAAAARGIKIGAQEPGAVYDDVSTASKS